MFISGEAYFPSSLLHRTSRRLVVRRIRYDRKVTTKEEQVPGAPTKASFRATDYIFQQPFFGYYSSVPSRNRKGRWMVFSSSSSLLQKNPNWVTTLSAGIGLLPPTKAGRLAGTGLNPPVTARPMGQASALITGLTAGEKLLFTGFPGQEPGENISHSGRPEKRTAGRIHSRREGILLAPYGKKFCPRTAPARRVEIHTTTNIFFRCMVLFFFLCRFTA